jgi:hypothetical protein
MELLTAVAVFLSPYLDKAGEKVAEETVKTLFEKRQDLAEKFKNLFKDEIIKLGLNENSNAADTTKLLQAKPEIEKEIRQKIENNQDLLNELVSALQLQDSRITINAKNIGQAIINPSGPIYQNNEFT